VRLEVYPGQRQRSTYLSRRFAVRLGLWHLTCRGGFSLRVLGPTQAPAVAAALLAVSELLAAEAVDDDASARRRLHADATGRKAAPGLRQGAEADHKSTV
jgi:hypothetical protein